MRDGQVSTGAVGQAARRAAFQQAVAAVDEPARSVLEATDAGALLKAAGRRPTGPQELPGRAVRAGFPVATAACPRRFTV